MILVAKIQLWLNGWKKAIHYKKISFDLSEKFAAPQCDLTSGSTSIRSLTSDPFEVLVQKSLGALLWFSYPVYSVCLFFVGFRETSSSRWSSLSMFVQFSWRWGLIIFHLSFLHWLNHKLVRYLTTASENRIKCRLWVSVKWVFPPRCLMEQLWLIYLWDLIKHHCVFPPIWLSTSKTKNTYILLWSYVQIQDQILHLLMWFLVMHINALALVLHVLCCLTPPVY